MAKPGRGGKDAVYERVRSIVPDCTDEEVHSALREALGDADQAVIALTTSAFLRLGMRTFLHLHAPQAGA